MTEDGTDCLASDIVYTATVDGVDWSTATTWITFDPATREVSWDTSTSSDSGDYVISVTGTITNEFGGSTTAHTATESFTLSAYTCATSTDTIPMYVAALSN